MYEAYRMWNIQYVTYFVKGKSDPNHFIREIDVEKRRI